MPEEKQVVSICQLIRPFRENIAIQRIIIWKYIAMIDGKGIEYRNMFLRIL